MKKSRQVILFSNISLISNRVENLKNYIQNDLSRIIQDGYIQDKHTFKRIQYDYLEESDDLLDDIKNLFSNIDKLLQDYYENFDDVKGGKELL